MSKLIEIDRVMTSVVTGLLLAIIAGPSLCQEKLQESPGGYHGELDLPVNWKQYYSYAEWTGIMHAMQKRYPHLADIESIGKSRMGRDQFVLTISAKSTGDHSEKTAIWVDGAIHGNEVNGISCALYLSWYLLTRYDYDRYVHELVDNCTFYVLPGLNVDANDSFVRFPNTPNNPREPFRPEDNDGDGLYDEDRTEDVDGDGELSTMYVEDPTGDFKLSADKRQFISVTDSEEKVQRFRRIGSEGFDNDGDGRINEDDIGGPDPNRNYPYGWTLGAGNPYPMSEPCTRNVFDFQRSHPNIFVAFNYHNAGRLIMFQAPPDTRGGQDQSAEERQQRQESLASRLEELRKTNKYAQLFDRRVAPEYRHDMDVQVDIVTVGARILKNYRPTTSGLNGQAPAASYYMLGAYSYLMELWGSPTFDADVDGDGRVSSDEYLEWIDIELGGEGWVVPHSCDHPDLGEVWIGGSPRKHLRRTPPGRYVEMEALKNAQFVMYCASQLPKVEVDQVEVKPVTKGLCWVEVAVKNDRSYPTASDRSVKLGRAVKDELTFASSENVSIVEIPEASTIIDPLDSRTRADVTTDAVQKFRLQGKQTLRFRYLVKMVGAKGWVEFKIVSQRGGTDQKRVTIEVD